MTTWQPATDRAQALLDLLVREADLDGLVTVNLNTLTESLHVSRRSVSNYLAALEKSGAIASRTVVHLGGPAWGGPGIAFAEYQLAESVIT